MKQVKEIQATGSFDLEAIIQAKEPVVVRGLVANWPSVERAKKGFDEMGRYLMSEYSGRPLTAYVGSADINGRFFYNESFDDFNFNRGQATLAQVLNKLSSCRNEKPSPTVYVGSTMIDEWFPRFNFENQCPISRDELLASIWIGNQSRVSAHYDFPDNIACVVAGRRQFTLFPPEQLENLYVGPIDNTPSGQEISVVDLKNPDRENFPRFRLAQEAALVANLDPGDGLFIPSMWWHHVEALDDLNVLVNYWWCDTPSYLGTPSVALKHALLAIRDLPKHQREHWKRLFDYYVFDDQNNKHEHIPASGRGVLSKLDAESADQLKQQILERLESSIESKHSKGGSKR